MSTITESGLGTKDDPDDEDSLLTTETIEFEGRLYKAVESDWEGGQPWQRGEEGGPGSGPQRTFYQSADVLGSTVMDAIAQGDTNGAIKQWYKDEKDNPDQALAIDAAKKEFEKKGMSIESVANEEDAKVIKPGDPDYEKTMKDINAWNELGASIYAQGLSKEELKKRGIVFIESVAKEYEETIKTVSTRDVENALRNAGSMGITNHDIIRQYFPEYDENKLTHSTGQYEIDWGDTLDNKIEKVGNNYVWKGESLAKESSIYDKRYTGSNPCTKCEGYGYISTGDDFLDCSDCNGTGEQKVEPKSKYAVVKHGEDYGDYDDLDQAIQKANDIGGAVLDVTFGSFGVYVSPQYTEAYSKEEGSPLAQGDITDYYSQAYKDDEAVEDTVQCEYCFQQYNTNTVDSKTMIDHINDKHDVNFSNESVANEYTTTQWNGTWEHDNYPCRYCDKKFNFKYKKLDYSTHGEMDEASAKLKAHMSDYHNISESQAKEEGIGSVSGPPAGTEPTVREEEDNTFVMPSSNSEEGIPKKDLKQRTARRVPQRDLASRELTQKAVGEYSDKDADNDQWISDNMNIPANQIQATHARSDNTDERTSSPVRAMYEEGHTHRWVKEDETDFCLDCDKTRPTQYQMGDKSYDGHRTGEVRETDSIMLNESYLEYNDILYRPLYIGENIQPELEHEGRLYTSEGVGNCMFCRGAGKITVERLGLKECPDCDGTGDVQGDQMMDPNAQMQPEEQLNPEEISPVQPEITGQPVEQEVPQEVPAQMQQEEIPQQQVPQQVPAQIPPQEKKKPNPFAKEVYYYKPDDDKQYWQCDLCEVELVVLSDDIGIYDGVEDKHMEEVHNASGESKKKGVERTAWIREQCKQCEGTGKLDDYGIPPSKTKHRTKNDCNWCNGTGEKEVEIQIPNTYAPADSEPPYDETWESKKKSTESKSCKPCRKTMAHEVSVSKFKKFVNDKIAILQKRARVGEAVSLMYGLPTVERQGRKIKGTLAYAGVSLNDRIYLPETLAKGHGKTLPLLLNHSSIAGAEDELDRLDDEMLEALYNEDDYEIGEVTLTWDASKLTLYYEGVVENEFFQKEIDDMDMAVSLGIYYDSDSPRVCDEHCYTLIKGAEFREVSLVYHAGFPIATIEAVEAQLKKRALKAIEHANDYNSEIAKEEERTYEDGSKKDDEIFYIEPPKEEDGEGGPGSGPKKGGTALLPEQQAMAHINPDYDAFSKDEGNPELAPMTESSVDEKDDENAELKSEADWEAEEAEAQEEQDDLARGGSVDVEETEDGVAPTIDLKDEWDGQTIVTEMFTPDNFSVRGVSGMTISNANGVERYTFDPTMNYSTNTIHFQTFTGGANIYGETLQPKMGTPEELTKIIEDYPDIVVEDSDKNAFESKKKAKKRG